jgi:hypothetical protein
MELRTVRFAGTKVQTGVLFGQTGPLWPPAPHPGNRQSPACMCGALVFEGAPYGSLLPPSGANRGGLQLFQLIQTA